MEVAVYNIDGTETGRTVSLSEAIFALETPSDHAIYQDVRQHLANRRQGTHKAKERSEISGTRKKPYRQKGTGNARAGSRQSPLWRHGGRVFGPKPRDYSFKLNKKFKQLARRSALTYKAREENIRVLENFEFEAPKTKAFIDILNKLAV
ncbi:MAG: 50S ribosomal protein L4, partial [Candidatus Riesia sp.]|nr:50S ribosomal protein L4 [Candidatus Riesia sp.]